MNEEKKSFIEWFNNKKIKIALILVLIVIFTLIIIMISSGPKVNHPKTSSPPIPLPTEDIIKAKRNNPDGVIGISKDHILIKFKDNVSEIQRAKILSEFGLSVKKYIPQIKTDHS